MSLLQIRDLDLSFNNQKVVENVNLSVKIGEVHGLIGESGSGKSLTALSVIDLLPKNCHIDKGEILFKRAAGQEDLLKLSRAELLKVRGAEIGFIFQDPMTAMNPVILCGRQVMEVLKIHTDLNAKARKEEVLALFKKVKLPDPDKIFNAYPHEISGGQQQRVMIAQAVACKPKLLLADEPTTALDVGVQMGILELLNDLRKSEALGVLFISHDLGLIAEFADTISIMYQGKIIESGSAKQIHENPQHPYTKGLLACRPPIDKRLERLPTISNFLQEKPSSNRPDSITEDVEKRNEVLMHIDLLSVYYPLKMNFLGKAKEELHALKNIGFEIFKGESLGLVGESGSGKSTLGRTLLKLIEAREGTIHYKGQEIRSLGERQFRQFRKNIQFIFQDPYSSLNPKIQIGPSIMEPALVFGMYKSNEQRKQKVFELLEQVGLSKSDYHKYPHEFSGGQRQRIVIARALILEPEFIICDEAVSALDVSVQAQILNLLKDLKNDFGLTYLFITHDLSVVRFFCDRVMVMNSGEIVEIGEADDIFSNPEHDYTLKLMEYARKLG